MHVVIAITCSLLYCVILPAYSMRRPVSGCNISCCRLFRRIVRCARSLSCTQLCRWSWWTHFIFQAFRCYLIWMALSHIYCNKFSFETFDVISVWLHSVINPSSTVFVSITNPGMILMHRDLTVWGRIATTAYASTSINPKLFYMSPPYLPICSIYLLFQVNLHVLNSKPSNNNLFCMPESLM